MDKEQFEEIADLLKQIVKSQRDIIDKLDELTTDTSSISSDVSTLSTLLMTSDLPDTIKEISSKLSNE